MLRSTASSHFSEVGRVVMVVDIERFATEAALDVEKDTDRMHRRFGLG